MNRRSQRAWMGLALGFSMTAGGCARVNNAWSAFTAPTTGPSKANEIASVSGEDATANAASDVAQNYDIAISPPPRVPVVNIFGELDGHSGKASNDSIDAAYQQHTFGDEGYDADPCVDPTGKWVVYSSTRHSEKPDIYVQRTDGTSVTQLTSDPADDAMPAFSPDGKTIAFCSTRAGSWDLYTMDLDGRSVTQITSGPSQDMHPSFSPDGARLAYCSIGGKSGQWELWVVNLGTRERKMIGYGLFPCWSSDKAADRIAFQRARQRGSRWFSLWTLDLVDGEARRVTEVAVSSNSAIVSPAWSPDGKSLAFSTVVEPAQMNKGKPRGQQDIWIVNADGGNRHRLTDGNGINLSPCWAIDRRIYFVSDRGGHENIWSVRAESLGAWPMAVKDNATPKDAGQAKTSIGTADNSEVEK